jgi:hypothetical protein
VRYQHGVMREVYVRVVPRPIFFFAFYLRPWAWRLVMDGKRDGEVSIGEVLIFGLVLGG